MPAWSEPTARFASSRSSIAERLRNQAWSSVSITGAIAAVSPTVWRGISGAKTIEYLRGREQVTRVYREAWRRVWIDDDPQQSVHALCYVVDRGHRQYAGQLSLADQLHYARQGHGRSGACRDYVLAAVKELQTLEIKDTGLQVLAERLRGAQNRPPAETLTASFARGPRQSDAPLRFQGHSAGAQKNSSLPRPGGIGSRISATTVPGKRRRERRGQNRPELSAIGRHGTPSAA